MAQLQAQRHDATMERSLLTPDLAAHTQAGRESHGIARDRALGSRGGDEGWLEPFLFHNGPKAPATTPVTGIKQAARHVRMRGGSGSRKPPDLAASRQES